MQDDVIPRSETRIGQAIERGGTIHLKFAVAEFSLTAHSSHYYSIRPIPATYSGSFLALKVALVFVAGRDPLMPKALPFHTPIL